MPLNFGATHTADSNVITRCHAGGVLVFLARFGSRMPAHLGRGFCLLVPTILAHTGLYLGHLILRGDRPHSKVVLTGLLLAADFAGVGMGQIAQNVNLPVSILVAARRDFFAFRRALHPAVLAMHIVKAILGAGGSLLVVNGPLVLQGRNILAVAEAAVSACSASMSRLLAGRLAVVLDHLVRHRSVMSTAAIEARVPMLIPRSSRNIRAGEVVAQRVIRLSVGVPTLTGEGLYTRLKAGGLLCDVRGVVMSVLGRSSRVGSLCRRSSRVRAHGRVGNLYMATRTFSTSRVVLMISSSTQRTADLMRVFALGVFISASGQRHHGHHANDQSQGQEHGEAALDEIVFVHFHIKFFLSLLGFRMQRIRRQGCHSRSFLWRPP